MTDSYCQILNRNQYKLTPQRKAVLDVLEQTRGTHMTAEDIYNEVKKINPKIGIATVYRTLELLARLDIVHKNSFDEGKYRYEFCEDDGHFHHHFLCSDCGAIIEVEEDFLNLLEGELERRGFKIIDHNLQLYGLCPDCNQKGNNPGER